MTRRHWISSGKAIRWVIFLGGAALVGFIGFTLHAIRSVADAEEVFDQEA